MELSDGREIGKTLDKEKNMLNTKFSEKELTAICQILKKHGTDCTTFVDILKLANTVAPNDIITTFKRVRLLKEFGIIEDRDLICHSCISEVVNLHALTCREYMDSILSKGYSHCPEEHYDYSGCEPAAWMVDGFKIHALEHKAAEKDWEEGRRGNIVVERGEPIFEGNTIIRYEKDKRRFNHAGRTNWLKEMFPDIDEDIRFNQWMGLLCERHVGSMRQFSDRITGYR
jgi:hypothetical protein